MQQNGAYNLSDDFPVRHIFVHPLNQNFAKIYRKFYRKVIPPKYKWFGKQYFCLYILKLTESHTLKNSLGAFFSKQNWGKKVINSERRR